MKKTKTRTSLPPWAELAVAIGDGRIDWRHYPKRAPEKFAKIFPHRLDVLRAYLTAAEKSLPVHPAPRPGDPGWRDAWFERLMAHIDFASPYRDFWRVLRADAATLPVLGRALLGVPPSGPDAMLRLVLYPWLISVWLRDNSADAQATMAALDRHLRRIESCIAYFCRPKEK
jgi:hypothetical protein